MSGAALVLAAALLAVAAALRAAGASLVRTPRAQALHDAADGDDRARRVADLLDERPRLQPAMGMVHSALLVAAGVPATWAITDLVSGWPTAVGLLVLAVVLVLGGDVLPRSWGRSRPVRLAYRFAPLLAMAVNIGDRAADLIQDEEDEDEAPDDEDQQDAEEIELISSVLDFTDVLVREVMVPRPDMVVAARDADTDTVRATIIEEGKSRIPVTGRDVDDIVGVLYAKDLLQIGDGDGPHIVADVMRPAYFVPETKRVSELMREMQAEQFHLAIVVDEFGGTAGLVTIEDLIEELVGEIADEYDVEEPMVTMVKGGGYLVDARLHIDDLGELLGIEFPDEEWDTVGGLMLELAGRVPREGESFTFDRWRLVAERVQGRRVAQVSVNPVP